MPSTDMADPNGINIRIRGGHKQAQTRCLEPLVNRGSLDQYKHRDLTPVIGCEYEVLQVRDLLRADNAVIKDLAVTSKISRKGNVENAY